MACTCRHSTRLPAHDVTRSFTFCTALTKTRCGGAHAVKPICDFIVAVPASSTTSFYTNARTGNAAWEDAVVKEFIPMIESTYRVNATRTTRGISGISMGGYGALKIAMKHPEMFGSVSAHSA